MSKRYYWIKLFEDFFTSKRIKKLRSIAGGDTYTIIYLKLQLKSLKTDGVLYYDGVMDSFCEELALDLDEKPEDVNITINFLKSVGLLEEGETQGEYRLPYTRECIGSETASTQRVREFRKRQKEQQALQCNTDETQMKQVSNVEIEIEKEIDIDIKEKDKKEKKTAKRFTPPTVEEVKAYCQERKNNINADQFVDFYTSKGWKVGSNPMKDWKAAVRTWENRDNKSIAAVNKKPPMRGVERKHDFGALEKRLTGRK